MSPKPTVPEAAQAFTAPASNPAPQAIAPPAAPPAAPPRSRNGRAKPTRPSRPAPKTSWKTLALTIRQARLGLNPEPLLPEAPDLELDQPLSKQRQDDPSHVDNAQRDIGEPQADGGETRSIAGDIQSNAGDTQPVMAEMQPVTDDIQIAIDDIQRDTSDTQPITNDTQTVTDDIQSDTDDTRHDSDEIQIVIEDTQTVTEDTQPPVSGAESDTDEARADTRDALAVDVEVLPPDSDTPINVAPHNTVTQPATVENLPAIRPKREPTSFASGLLLLVYQLACPPQIIESLNQVKRHKPKKTSAKHRR
ncbi:MAG: hypothetical protein AAFX78_07495 [Cyanobacteria bacterium J06638_20]